MKETLTPKSLTPTLSRRGREVGMTQKQLREAMRILLREVPTWDVPVVTLIAQESRDPYRVLISTLLSLRTLDQTTGPAAQRLFALADTPEAMLHLDRQTIERTIYPVGFYRNKAKSVVGASRGIIETFGGQVPDEMDKLLTLPGVARKTANVVLGSWFGKAVGVVSVKDIINFLVDHFPESVLNLPSDPSKAIPLTEEGG